MTEYTCKKCGTNHHGWILRALAACPVCDECDEEFGRQYSDCRDHQMDDLRAEVANLKDRLALAESRARYKEATIKELLDGLDSLRKSVNAERGR